MIDLPRRYLANPVVWAVIAAALTPSAALRARAETQTIAAGPPFAEVLLERLRAGTHRESFIAQTLAPLRQLDTDGDGLNQRDVERADMLARTRERARVAQELLNMDFNGDLKVERAEVLEFFGTESERRAGAADAMLQRLDTNHDGAATLAEALAAAPSSPSRSDSGVSVASLLVLDPDGDGRITARELAALAGSAFDYFDADRDGTVSEIEASAIRAEQRLARQVRERRESGCFFAPPSADARFIAYAPYGAQTVSTVFVGSPDIETGVIDVRIEPGAQPLYLVLMTHDSTIWRFTGATGRIERVVATSTTSKSREEGRGRGATSAVGVVGVARDRVQIASRDCLPDFADKREIDAGVPQEGLAALFSRPPDAIARENPIGTLSLPSLAITRFKDSEKPAPLPGFDPVIWGDAVGFFPGGLVKLAAKDVVAAEPVGDYDVLPSKFGLAALVASGQVRFEGDASFRRKFILLRPIARWPAEMNGALSTAFVKPSNIPMPEGKLGHSCVLSVEQGTKANWERLCQDALISSIPEVQRPSEDKLRR